MEGISRRELRGQSKGLNQRPAESHELGRGVAPAQQDTGTGLASRIQSTGDLPYTNTQHVAAGIAASIQDHRHGFPLVSPHPEQAGLGLDPPSRDGEAGVRRISGCHFDVPAPDKLARRLGQHGGILRTGVLVVGPGKDAEVRRGLHNGRLQPAKGLHTLAVDQRHVDVEDTQQAVRQVLDPRRLPRGGPRHPARDCVVAQLGLLAEKRFGDARDGTDEPGEVLLASAVVPCRLHQRLSKYFNCTARSSE